MRILADVCNTLLINYTRVLSILVNFFFYVKLSYNNYRKNNVYDICHSYVNKKMHDYIIKKIKLV